MHQILYFFFLFTLLTVHDFSPLSAKKTAQSYACKHNFPFLALFDQPFRLSNYLYFSKGISKVSHRQNIIPLYYRQLNFNFSISSSFYNAKFFGRIVLIHVLILPAPSLFTDTKNYSLHWLHTRKKAQHSY